MTFDIAGAVAELRAALAAVPQLRAAVTDPADLNLPGAWVRADGLSLAFLNGYTVPTTVYLVVPDQPPDRAYAALSELLNACKATFDSFGGAEPDLQLVGLALPGSQTPLPALVVQIKLDATYETEI